jgi:hypothetical protein
MDRVCQDYRRWRAADREKEMSQSTLIVGGVLAAFFVWVVLNGHLGNYLQDLGL